MAGLNRVTELLKEAVTVLESGNSSRPASASGNSEGQRTRVPSTSSELRNIFAPYRRPPSRPHSRNNTIQQRTTWTHKFCCLYSPSQEAVPDKSTKKEMSDAGLGEKKLVLEKNKSADYLRDMLYENFFKLKDGGGFELMRSTARVSLDTITMPPSGYTTHFLSDESGIGGAIIYIRPMQESISLDPVNIEPSDDCIKELCKGCMQHIPVFALREHMTTCYTTKDSDEELLQPSHIKKQKRDRPICDFACVNNHKSEAPALNTHDEKDGIVCPVCQTMCGRGEIENHAATCGETNIVVSPNAAACVSNDTKNPSNTITLSSTKSLTDVLEKKRQTMEGTEGHFSISVVRRWFVKTSMEQLKDSIDNDWMKPVRVTFIGEEGVDAGGLTREFFSLMFQKTTVFDADGFFTIDSQMLQQKEYCLMGKVTALAIINGHPGPHTLNNLLATYIMSGKEPNAADVLTEQVHGGDVHNAIEQIQNASSEMILGVFEQHVALLQEAGFRKVLTIENRTAAIIALKLHNSLYKFMAPMLQFMEGLKLHDILQLLQANQEEGLTILSSGSKYPSPEEVQELYTVNYSTGREEKELEQMIVYNLNRFLKKVERGSVTTKWIDLNSNTEQTSEEPVTLNMGHVLQAFIGCSRLPRNIGKGSGTIEFDHSTQRLSHVNTCAPGICFSSTKSLTEFEHVEKHLICIILEAEGFGLV